MLPLNTMLYVHLVYSTDVNLDWSVLLLSLLNTVVSISLGLFAGNKAPRHRATFNAVGQVAGVLLMIISAVFAQKKQPIWDRDASFYAATCMPFFFSALIATVVASLLKLAKPEQVAVVIETCYQNIAFATTVAISSFEPDTVSNPHLIRTSSPPNRHLILSQASLAAGVPVLYGLLEVIFIAVWCTVTWQLGWTYAPASDKLPKVLFTNYQPGAEESAEGDGTDGTPQAICFMNICCWITA